MLYQDLADITIWTDTDTDSSDSDYSPLLGKRFYPELKDEHQTETKPRYAPDRNSTNLLKQGRRRRDRRNNRLGTFPITLQNNTKIYREEQTRNQYNYQDQYYQS